MCARMILAGSILAIASALPLSDAAGQTSTGGTQIALGIYQGPRYDAVANCLMRQMSTYQVSAWPLVYAPPRTEAYVNLWFRGREHELPVAVFHVKQRADGSTHISFEEPAASGRRHEAAARVAAQRCGN